MKVIPASSLESLGQMLAKKYRITVRYDASATTACMNPVTKEIIMPYLSGVDAVNMPVYRGIFDHEIGHALFSPEKTLHEAFFERFPKLQFTFSSFSIQKITNIFEDPRVEKLMARKYKGSKENLSSLINRFFSETDFYSQMKNIASSSDSLSSALGSLMLLALRNAQYKQGRPMYIVEDWLRHHMVDVYQFTSIVRSGLKAETFDDVCQCVVSFLEMCREVEQNNSNSASNSTQNTSQSGQAGQSGSEEQSGDASSDESDSSSDESDSSSDDEESSGHVSSSSSDDEESESNASSSSSSSSSSTPLAGDFDFAGKINSRGFMDGTDISEKAFSALKDKQNNGYFGCDDACAYSQAPIYKPQRSPFDITSSFSSSIDSIARGVYMQAKRHMHALVQDMQLEHAYNSVSGLELDATLLPFYKTTDKLFIKRDFSLVNEAEFAIVLDTSGSVSQYASEYLGVSLGIYNSLRTLPKCKVWLMQYNSSIDCVIFPANMRLIASDMMRPHGGTPTGGAIVKAVSLFSPHRTRKNIICVTDGYPDNAEYVNRAVSLCKRENIILYSLHVLSSATTGMPHPFIVEDLDNMGQVFKSMVIAMQKNTWRI